MYVLINEGFSIDPLFIFLIYLSIYNSSEVELNKTTKSQKINSAFPRRLVQMDFVCKFSYLM